MRDQPHPKWLNHDRIYRHVDVRVIAAMRDVHTAMVEESCQSLEMGSLGVLSMMVAVDPHYASWYIHLLVLTVEDWVSTSISTERRE